MKRLAFFLIPLFALLPPLFARAQDSARVDVWRARMIDIASQATPEPEGTVDQPFQTLRAELLSGPKKGETVLVANDHLRLREGQSFFLNHVVDLGGEESYQAIDADRLGVLYALIALFALVILGIGGWQGARSLVSLAGSVFVILFLLLPPLLRGAPPVLTSVGVAAVILVIALYSTHGWNRRTHAAFLGTTLTVAITGLLATVAVRVARLTGFSSDEAVYLNGLVEGRLDVRGLLLGGIIIGILGILDDIAVTQAAVVQEMRHASPGMKPLGLYRRALNVGKEHVGALVNTLALAYAGSALPLLLLIRAEQMPALAVLNSEVVATEVVRTIVGSIGLVLAVPITTALAVLLVRGEDGADGAHAHAHH